MTSVQQPIKPEDDRLSDEKTLENQPETPHKYVADLPPDPDSHLSAEERAAIVSFSKTATILRYTWLSTHYYHRTANFCGSLT